MGIYNQDLNYEPNIHDEAVWVANRNNPIPDIYSKLIIDENGKFSILSGAGTVLDLFTPTSVPRNASVTLLNNGNLVLQELYPNGSKGVLWQSFDYPTDTLLPGMKLGVNLKTGHRWSLTSWRSEQLPADGSFTLTGDPNGTGQLFILWRGSINNWMSGPWQNGQFENTNLQSSGPDFNLYYTSNESEKSFSYLTKTYHSFPALRLYPDGQLKGSTLKLDIRCSSINSHGHGCAAEYKLPNLKCRKDHYFARRYGYIYTYEYVYDESYNFTLHDCNRLCWRNCSCTAYTYSTKNRAGCKTYGHMIYNPKKANHTDKEFFALVKYEGKAKKFQKVLLPKLLHKLRHFYNNIRRDKKMNNELRYFTFQSILSATNKFSSMNKLGEGGFGAVYKGRLVDGQEVAVKRLSSSSAQGVKEFKNETELIVKLQHTNLVRLLGCCIEKQEKILGLLYLHKFSRRKVIHRDLKASNILLDDYLRPKISDFGMAKLFGINESEANTSRVVGTLIDSQTLILYLISSGYMPPEYMREGVVSTKTDVFSFGVLLLEIVSSKKNYKSYDVDHPLNDES
ncbi:hypothetical protein OSB04_005445 [Centaurea solstitialis]|uniref:non-specific serine/threonine protein kinase n=1 Tax=Centaurea solstitialis TaxID=347529 RepID=A0AA38WPN7_9ASTR|nr:hypothetical protein OSB04_005445 [Centaurea solstitialis]